MGFGGIKANGSALSQKIFKGIGLDKAISRTSKGLSKDLDAAETVLTKGGVEKFHGDEIKGLEGDALKSKEAEIRKKAAEQIGLTENSKGGYGPSGREYLGISADEKTPTIVSDTIAKKREALAKGGFGGITEATDSTFGSALDVAGQYYLGGTKMENAKHIAGTIGAGALGARLLSGGTPVTNSNGERDIVGLPFI